MKEKMMRDFARIILGTGINLQKGQNLLLRGEPVLWDFFNVMAEEAYKMGARFVRVEAPHPGLAKARYDHVESAFEEYVPGYIEPTLQSYLDENWASVYIDGSDDPDIFDECDKSRMGRIASYSARKTHFYSKAVSANKIRWNVAAMPARGWAEKVFPGMGADAALERLTAEIVRIMRLDHPDPAVEWKRLSSLLQKRSELLNAAKLHYLHFTGGKTDLKVYLNPKSVWLGGAGTGADGVVFMPNLPTEEVFTTPDYRRTEGIVFCTRPVEVLGSGVEGAWFRFENGKVVEFGADKGRDILEQYLAMDKQAPYLGEVALVDVSSPIFQSGVVFHSILFDENAACHIALGSGYADAIEGGVDMSDEELDAAGHNNTTVHTDFMIGGPAVSVTGYTRDGRAVPVIENGGFVIK